MGSCRTEHFGQEADPGSELSRFGLGSPRDHGLGRCVTSATPVSGTGITGGGSGYAALLAHAGWVLYGMELGSVTLKINNQHTLGNNAGIHSDSGLRT
jgi:hypothetical protein